jgi:2-polyprenyl-3-methyl-5-hydroxy-6-metoxy-1,4-benzoquinol methylase
MEVRCNNCEQNDFVKLHKAACYATRVPLNVVQCKQCGLVYLNPRPDKSLGLAYFEQAYSNAEGFEDHDYYRDHEAIFKRNRKRFEMINALNSPNKKILDFGAGQGHFVKVARDMGWQGEGTELSPAAIAAAQANFGLTLHDNLDAIQVRDFGVIALWDVIEHLEDPKGILQMLSEYLHPDGYFIIETANIDSLDYALNREKWSYWHVDHLYYFSKKTLRYLLETLKFEIIPAVGVLAQSTTQKRSKLSKLKKLLKPGELSKALRTVRILMQKPDIDRGDLMTLIGRRMRKS